MLTKYKYSGHLIMRKRRMSSSNDDEYKHRSTIIVGLSQTDVSESSLEREKEFTKSKAQLNERGFLIYY